MEIKQGTPPNYAEIVKVLPHAKRDTTIFAYGDVIYSKSGRPLAHHLMVHEAVHGIRQKELGVEAWWARYLEDTAFRFFEELVAHCAEYKCLADRSVNRAQRRTALKVVAKRLASPLYGHAISWKQTSKLIEIGIERGLHKASAVATLQQLNRNT